MSDLRSLSDLESVAGRPSWHPPLAVLELVELVLCGALKVPPVAILPPPELGAGRVVLEDAEGTPVAVLRPPGAGAGPAFEALRPFSHGPLRGGRRSPSQVWAELRATKTTSAPTGLIVVLVTSSISTKAVEAVLARASESNQAVLWLAVLGAQRPTPLPPAGLWRVVRGLAEDAVAAGIVSVAAAVAVPKLPPAPRSAPDDGTLLRWVAQGYRATEVCDPTELDQLNAPPHPRFAAERERAVPPPGRRGVTVFFTGLSGSGKSTVAKALAERLTEHTRRTVSLLDGDEVRRLLSAGLGYSRADRDLNIRRVGFVATEVSRHGGMAICAPIAPFAQARAEVRAGVEEVGDFVLVHISTPLAECERRDRKGLYARARQGLIPDFTGISSPYEEPGDADLRLDTSRLEVAEAVQEVWTLLAGRGYLESPLVTE